MIDNKITIFQNSPGYKTKNVTDEVCYSGTTREVAWIICNDFILPKFENCEHGSYAGISFNYKVFTVAVKSWSACVKT